jgi:cytochrome c oxidase cbb3-type subunit 4
MTIDDLRIAVTVVSFVSFLGLMAWAWSARNRARFDEAAHLIFAPDGTTAAEAPTPTRSQRP